MMPLDLDLDSLAAVIKQLPDGAKPAITIYCDGACSGNPGPGGWGAVILYEGQEWDIFGGEPYTTNNRMELAAALQALTALPRSSDVNIYTDSQYMRNGMMLWMLRWKANGWMTADKKPVKNQDLWQCLDDLMKTHTVSWHWVKAHAGDRLNERADNLARHAIVQQSIEAMRTKSV